MAKSYTYHNLLIVPVRMRKHQQCRVSALRLHVCGTATLHAGISWCRVVYVALGAVLQGHLAGPRTVGPVLSRRHGG